RPPPTSTAEVCRVAGRDGRGRRNESGARARPSRAGSTLAGAQQCLIRIESRPRARGYRSNDGGGGGAVRMVVLYDDGRPGLADLRAQRGVERDEPELPAAWTRYRRRRAGHVSASTAAQSAASRESRSRFTRP